MKIILPTLFLLLLVGAAFSAEQEAALRSIPTREKLIALTFDDGPDEQTQEFLKILADEECRATFFVLGKNIKKHGEMTRRMAEAGHELGNHSWSHAKFPTLTAKEIDQEIAETQQIITEESGQVPTLFRAPYLQYDDNTWAALRKHGLTAVNASHGTRDYEKEATPEQIIERATKNLQPGSIILMHSFSEATLAAMPEMIRTLKEKGYRCVTVSEML